MVMAKKKTARKRKPAKKALKVRQRKKSPPLPEPVVRSRAEFQAHKLDLGAERLPEPAPPQFIPWGYGTDRVRALPVDPDRLYVYWEVTDEGRDRARKALGARASESSLHLRIYDTTGRLFDGTNAHSYFDHPIEDGARQRFFDIQKPGSDAFVEIGMKSDDGSFARIARSPRVSFPRREPAPRREPQWLTVRSFPEPAAAQEPTPIPGPTEPAPRGEPYRPVIEPAPARAASPPEEPRWIFEVDGRTHVASGPSEVVVRDVGAFERRRVLSRWVLYESWTLESGGAPEGAVQALEILGGSSALAGGSERRFRGASERRLAGASELLYRGASGRSSSREASGRR
jgi:hypothetical protein